LPLGREQTIVETVNESRLVEGEEKEEEEEEEEEEEAEEH
jgi:hypothetical protein